MVIAPKWQAWRQDFAAARNFGFDRAAADYCMWMDADEILRPDDAAALRAMRHIMLCDTADVFRFQLAEESTRHLAAVSKSYVLQCLDKPFKTEDFLNTILGTV